MLQYDVMFQYDVKVPVSRNTSDYPAGQGNKIKTYNWHE